MDPASPFPAIASLLVAWATALLLTKQFGAPPDQGRYSSIDGLRGYLAFFVFLHHACVWYFYLRTGQWKVPPSNLYTNFGQGSVAVFFMITGFLFFSKLINGRKKDIDWGKLFISRFLRLVPLYLFAMLLLFLVVAYVSHGILNESLPRILAGAAKWLSFTILGEPNLNGINYTSTIVAGVTWSLPYEWVFYFSLPVLALTVGVMPPFRYVALGMASIVSAVIWWHPQIYPLLAFFGGIIASFLVRLELFRRFSIRRVSSFISLACIAIAFTAYPSAYGIAPLLLLSVAFALIASGNSLFGSLTSPVSRTLGEMAYSIYLLQGVTLFVTFNFIVGLPESRALSPITHWLLIVGITPVLVLACFVTFRLIEHPAMRSATTVTDWLRSRLTRRAKKLAASGTPLS
jgi:peptidoglycan/LPS O-acetylase OafA/YrhL